MSAADTIWGKWKSVKKEGNAEEFWSASGIPSDVSNKLANAEFILEVWQEGGKKFHKVSWAGTSGKAHEFDFGKEIQYDNDGYSTKVTMTVDGNKFIEKFRAEDGGTYDTVREINGDEMKTVTTTKAGSTTMLMKKVK